MFSLRNSNPSASCSLLLWHCQAPQPTGLADALCSFLGFILTFPVLSQKKQQPRRYWEEEGGQQEGAAPPVARKRRRRKTVSAKPGGKKRISGVRMGCKRCRVCRERVVRRVQDPQVGGRVWCVPLSISPALPLQKMDPFPGAVTVPREKVKKFKRGAHIKLVRCLHPPLRPSA